jgi:hypothetical protein
MKRFDITILGSSSRVFAQIETEINVSNKTVLKVSRNNYAELFANQVHLGRVYVFAFSNSIDEHLAMIDKINSLDPNRYTSITYLSSTITLVNKHIPSIVERPLYVRIKLAGELKARDYGWSILIIGYDFRSLGEPFSTKYGLKLCSVYSNIPVLDYDKLTSSIIEGVDGSSRAFIVLHRKRKCLVKNGYLLKILNVIMPQKLFSFLLRMNSYEY